MKAASAMSMERSILVDSGRGSITARDVTPGLTVKSMKAVMKRVSEKVKEN